MRKTQDYRVNPRVKDVLKLIGAGILISSALIVPAVAIAGGLVMKEHDRIQQEKERKALSRYKMWRVRQIIQRLQKQKMITIKDDLIVITNHGKRKILKYDLDKIKLREKADGKWRIIIYDVAELNKREREAFRGLLRKLKFLQIQKSVYITPYPCGDEIEYIRQKFGIGSGVKMIVATGLEEAEAYKAYFGI